MRILALPFSDSLAHLSRVLAIGTELRARGHEVAIAGDSPRLELAAGFQVLPAYEPDPAVLFDRWRRGRTAYLTDAELARMIDADLAVIREFQPDLVLSDGRFSARLSTQMAGLRHVAVTNAMHTEYRAVPYLPLPDWLLPLERALYDGPRDVFRRASRERRLARPVRTSDCLQGNDHTLLADAPEFFPSRALPPQIRYIGPITWRGALAPPAWWPPAEPIVYVTMGTTGIPAFFDLACEVLRDTGWTAVVSTGGQAREPAPPGPRVFVADYLDGDLVTAASRLVICHGGSGTIYQALRHGKPVIGIPTAPGQRFNMRRVVALGVGARLPWERFRRKPGALLPLIEQVAGDAAMARRAAALRERLLPYHAERTAADLIEELSWTWARS